MKVRIKNNDRWSLRFGIPTILMLNRLTAFMISKWDKDITYRQAWTIVREVKHYRRKHGKWKLVEVQTASGEEVEVII